MTAIGMKRLTWIFLGGVALVAVLFAMTVAAYLLWGLPDELGTVTVNGEVVDLHGAHAGHWVLATLGLLLAAAIVMVVVPLVMVAAFVVPLTFTALGLLLSAVAAAVVLSPLLLLLWWLGRLWKRRRKPDTIVA